MPLHSLGHQGQNSFVLFVMWLTQMARYLPWPVSSNLFFTLFPPLERVWQHMSLSAERVWGSHADDPQAIKTSHRPCLSKLHLLLQRYIFFAVSIGGLIWPDVWPALLTKIGFSLFCVFLSGRLFDLAFTWESSRAEGKRELQKGWRREKSHRHVGSSRDGS